MDSFLCSPEGYKALNKMKDAWSQKKSRDRNNGKKSYNFVMDKGIKSKLGAIAKHHKKTINETIQLLIEERYKQEHKQEKEHNIILPIMKFMHYGPPTLHPTDKARYENRPAPDRGPITKK